MTHKGDEVNLKDLHTTSFGHDFHSFSDGYLHKKKTMGVSVGSQHPWFGLSPACHFLSTLLNTNLLAQVGLARMIPGLQSAAAVGLALIFFV